MKKYIIRVKDERNILHSKKEGTLTGSVTFHKNCLLKPAFEEKIQGMIEVMGRYEGRHKQLLDDLKQTTAYWKLKAEALDHTL
jgi:hypothetical protein